MSFRRWILFPLAFSSAVFAYLSLEKLTGGDPALFRTDPKPFVAPPQPFVPPPAGAVEKKEIPAPPEIVPAVPKSPVQEWTKLPAQP